MAKAEYPDLRVIGLMSGTSLDGMDMVRAHFHAGAQGSLAWEMTDYEERPWPDPLRARLLRAAEDEPLPLSELAALHDEVARRFSEFLKDIWPASIPAELAAFPGQTVHHAPGRGFGFQLGNPSVFSSLTGLETVADFRSPDLALGGQGAPLAPLADALLRRDSRESRAIVNIGGIANLTLLPPGRGSEAVRAWDSGPGNMLMDRAAALLLGRPFDRDGEAASRGRVCGDLLHRWLENPYFREAPPKSTGREVFGSAFLADSDMGRLGEEIGAESLMATLLELTVESLARDLEFSGVQAAYLSGGGACNLRLVSRMAERLPSIRIGRIEELGCPAGAKEALDFALLAYLARMGRPVSLAGVTGARRNAPAGVLSPPPGGEG